MTLMSTLTTMKFDGSRTIHEHIIEMTNIIENEYGCEFSFAIYYQLVTS
jgi:hypothetical protein